MVVESTADIIAIISSATTFLIAIFGVIRYSRCQTIKCCGCECIRDVVSEENISNV